MHVTKIFIGVVFLLLWSGCTSHTKKYHEKYYQTIMCNDLDGKMEYVLKDRTRVDCLTDEYAIEVDFAKKWAESIGQSLFYAEMTGKKPAIGLIVGKNDSRYLKRVRFVADKFDIRIIKIKKIE